MDNSEIKNDPQLDEKSKNKKIIFTLTPQKIKVGIIITFIAFLLMSLLTLILYFTKFNSALSNNSSDWANFGAFISGTVGVMATIANVIIVIVIAWLVQEHEKKIFISGLKYRILESLNHEISEHIIKLNSLEKHNITLEAISKILSSLQGKIIEINSWNLFNIAAFKKLIDDEISVIHKSSTISVKELSNLIKRLDCGYHNLMKDIFQISLQEVD